MNKDFIFISGDSHDDSNDESSISVSSQSENNASPMMMTTTYTITPNYQCKLIDFHKNVDEFSRKYFEELIEDLKAQFEQFARTEESFNRLSLNDQSKLLEFNTPLYVQYLIAGYFNESSGSGQIQVLFIRWKKIGVLRISMLTFWVPFQWFLNNYTPDDNDFLLRRVSFHEFNDSVKLFHSAIHVGRYNSLLNSVKRRQEEFSKLSFKASSVILFYPNNFINFFFDDIQLIHEAYEKNTAGLDHDYEPLVDLLQEMVEMFYNFGFQDYDEFESNHQIVTLNPK